MRKRNGFGWLELIEGILLIILGIYTFTRPEEMLTGVVMVYGLVALFTGIADIVFYIKMEKHIGFGVTISLVSGILSVLAGLTLLVYPGVGRWAFALFFPLWFICHCISRLSHLNVVRLMAGNFFYYFTLIVNVLGLIMGVLMLLSPAVAFMSFGMITGIYLILLGIDSLVLALSKMSYWS